MTQSKIERRHRSLKNQVLLESCYVPGELKARSADASISKTPSAITDSLNNLTPGTVYTGHGQTALARRRKIKQKTSGG